MQRILALIVAAVVLAFGATAAAAKPKRKVKIVSDPPGATVYIGDKKYGAKGKTPVTLSLSTGDTTLIVELDGYQPHIESVTIDPGKGPQPFSFTLDKSVGTIRLGGLSDSAHVTVDGNDVTPTEGKVEVDPGAHEVVVKGGGSNFDQWIEVAAGEDKFVTVGSGGGGGGGDDAPGSDNPNGVEAHATVDAGGRAEHPWYGTAGVSYEAGWRRFSYASAAAAGNQRSYSANGVGMVDFWGEVAPWRSSHGAHALWPLSIVAGFGVGFPVTATTPDGQNADTYWRTTSVSLRYRIPLGKSATIALEGGWARLLYTFRDSMNGLVASIPDVDYESVRLGARAEAKVGIGKLWISGEKRLVLSSGEEDSKATGASAGGLGGTLGFDVPFVHGVVVLRVEGNLFRYSWSYEPGGMSTDLATDTLFGFNIGLGISY